MNAVASEDKARVFDKRPVGKRPVFDESVAAETGEEPLSISELSLIVRMGIGARVGLMAATEAAT